MLVSIREDEKLGLTSTIFCPSGTATKFIPNSIFRPWQTENNGLLVIFRPPGEKDLIVP